MLNLSLAELLKIIPAVLLGLTVHELAHAFIALKLGDDTPKLLGRLTINPIKHIDPIGFILLLVAGFGWAKPVVINRQKLKNPVRDDILIAVSGPIANLLLAIVLAVFLKMTILFTKFHSREAFEIVTSTFLVFVSINVALGLFNLLPIPPLDGSHFIWSPLSTRNPASAAIYFRYGSFALLALIIMERIANIDILPIGAAVTFVVRALLRLVALA
jgi:Zn-dependent protease